MLKIVQYFIPSLIPRKYIVGADMAHTPSLSVVIIFMHECNATSLFTRVNDQLDPFNPLLINIEVKTQFLSGSRLISGHLSQRDNTGT